jgi:ATP-dependent RNA helicase RhlE
MHGGKEQNDRLSVMKKFAKGEIKILIATDVSARGIDIPDVDYVVNYDLPDEPENYVHRVGRTGRGIKKGQAVSFCGSEEKEKLEEIEIYLGKKINEMTIDKNDYKQTIAFSNDTSNDNWRLLLEENNRRLAGKKRKK